MCRIGCDCLGPLMTDEPVSSALALFALALQLLLFVELIKK